MRKFLSVVFLSVIAAILSLTASAQNSYVGVWSGKLSVAQQELTIVFNLDKDDAGALLCTMDSPDQGARGIKAEASVDQFMSLTVDISSIGASYKGLMIKESIYGTFTQSGKSFTLNLKKGAEVLNRPQTPVGPFPYTEEEVEFVNQKAGATLAGTLVIPENATSSTPVVIMVSGSGLQNRDEEIFEHKPFMVIADYLARNGIATLRYDDRTVGKSHGGDVKNATTIDFMEDAKAGIEYLKSRGLFSKVGVLGHSEGGSIAFMLGASKDADFVVSLASLGEKGDIALCAQANKVLELSGVQQKLSVEQYRMNALSAGDKWTEWFINYDPKNDIKACSCPVFAVNGDKDIQVISSVNLPFIEKTLGSLKTNFIKEYPGLNHLFQHCETGNTTEYRTSEETFSEDVLEDLARWIGSIR